MRHPRPRAAGVDLFHLFLAKRYAYTRRGLTPKQDDLNKIPELQVCTAEALYDVDSIVADPGAYTKEELASLHNQIVSNLEQAWELTGGSEDQLIGTMLRISQAGCFSGTVLGDACQLGCARVA